MKKNQSATAKDTRIGVLLTDVESGKRIGFIEFDPSGMLVPHVFLDTVHVFALNPIVRIFKEPLYGKHGRNTSCGSPGWTSWSALSARGE